jgi:hypothetical protein
LDLKYIIFHFISFANCFFYICVVMFILILYVPNLLLQHQKIHIFWAQGYSDIRNQLSDFTVAFVVCFFKTPFSYKGLFYYILVFSKGKPFNLLASCHGSWNTAHQLTSTIVHQLVLSLFMLFIIVYSVQVIIYYNYSYIKMYWKSTGQ